MAALISSRRAALQARPAPDLRDKVRRCVWNIAWALLFRPSPRPLHAWRRVLLRLFGAKIGVQAHPYPGARIWSPWNLVMAESSCLADGSNCYNVAKVVLGPRAIVSQGAYLCTASHAYNSPGFELQTAEIVLGADCWVATEAFIGPGVTLHDGSVALARAVVVRDVAAFDVVGGNPARSVGTRTRDALSQAEHANKS